MCEKFNWMIAAKGSTFSCEFDILRFFCVSNIYFTSYDNSFSVPWPISGCSTGRDMLMKNTITVTSYERYSATSRRQIHYLFKGFFSLTTKKISKLCVIGRFGGRSTRDQQIFLKGPCYIDMSWLNEPVYELVVDWLWRSMPLCYIGCTYLLYGLHGLDYGVPNHGKSQ